MANLQSLLDDTNLTRFLMHETRDSIHSVLIVARAHVTNMHSRTSGSSPAKIDASKMNIYPLVVMHVGLMSNIGPQIYIIRCSFIFSVGIKVRDLGLEKPEVLFGDQFWCELMSDRNMNCLDRNRHRWAYMSFHVCL